MQRRDWNTLALYSSPWSSFVPIWIIIREMFQPRFVLCTSTKSWSVSEGPCAACWAFGMQYSTSRVIAGLSNCYVLLDHNGYPPIFNVLQHWTRFWFCKTRCTGVITGLSKYPFSYPTPCQAFPTVRLTIGEKSMHHHLITLRNQKPVCLFAVKEIEILYLPRPISLIVQPV